MKFPIVSRRKYEQMTSVAARLCARVLELEDERDGIIGRAAELADIERQDRKIEREHVEAILRNLREVQSGKP